MCLNCSDAAPWQLLAQPPYCSGTAPKRLIMTYCMCTPIRALCMDVIAVAVIRAARTAAVRRMLNLSPSWCSIYMGHT